MAQRFIPLLFGVAILVLSGCSRKGCTDPAALNYDAEAKRDDRSCSYGDKYATQKEQIIAGYADIAFALYDDTYDNTVGLQIAIDAFLDDPTTKALNQCKESWAIAHANYELCEVLRFANGPIDDERGLHDRINGWPITESFVDYTSFDGDAGIVKDTANFPEISKDLLDSIHAPDNNGSIALGFHVIEYLLWGQDISNPGLNSPGLRPVSDYVSSDSNSFAGRRSTYLRLCTQMLLSDISIITSEWDPSVSNNYRASFLTQSSDRSMKDLLTGLGTLVDGELSGRNMFDPVYTQDYRLEQSEFSDNTVQALQKMAGGATIIYQGKYKRDDGTVVEGSTSLHKLMLEVDADLAEELSNRMDEALNDCTNIPSPFDYQITLETVDGDGPVAEAINTTQKLATKIREMAEALDLGITTSL